MEFDEYLKLTASDSPPDVSDYLLALWYDKKRNWKKAHEIAQEIDDVNGSWIHAYLHRKEGDIMNAGYWYARCAKKMPDYSLEEEWETLTRYFLNRGK